MRKKTCHLAQEARHTHGMGATRLTLYIVFCALCFACVTSLDHSFGLLGSYRLY